MTAQGARHWPRLIKRIAALAVVGAVASTIMLWPDPQASAIASGDGLLFYGASGNTNPQVRTYTDGTGFGSPGGTVNGAIPQNATIRTSPTKQEAIAGYADANGILHILCYDGSNWTEDWTDTVAGVATPTTRRFDIAYE